MKQRLEKRNILWMLCVSVLLTGCGFSQQGKQADISETNNTSSSYSLLEEGDTVRMVAQLSPSFRRGQGEVDTMPQGNPAPAPCRPTACRFDSLGLVNIAELDSTIAVSLLYATPNNFVGEVMYDDLTEAYLHPEAAEALLKAQRLLKEKHPDYTLIIYDATRPMFAQRKMWDLVKGTSKSIYVSNPSRGGGLHNYGLAVDISILDENGVPLDMGTEVDHLGPEAHITNEADFVRKGIITQQAKENRELLRSVMRGAGFRALHSEWWHFNLYSREVAKKNYKLID